MHPGPTLIFATALVSSSNAKALEHPPVLEQQSGCEDWIGTASGNDPSVRLNLQLCPTDDGGVQGNVQWSSLRSGWNLRAVEGSWSGDSLTLRDVVLRESHPEPGWRFCLIESWLLQREDDRLAGGYSSTECDDNADVTLNRMDRPDAVGNKGPRSRGAPSRPASRDESEHIDSAPARSGAGCGCHVDDTGRGLPVVSAFGLAVLGLRRRRRPRLRTHFAGSLFRAVPAPTRFR